MPPEPLVFVTARRRPGDRLADWAEGPDPALADLQLPDAPYAIGGGEPTLRPDLPALLARLAAHGQPFHLVTDGLPLRSPAALAALKRQGLRAVRLVVAAPRKDAHDWLVGQPGAFAAAVAAARAIRAAGLRLELASAVSRPAAPLVADLVDLAVRLDAAALHLRALRRRGALVDAWVSLAPRWARLEPHLRAAAARAERAHLPLSTEGWPACVAPAATVRPVAPPSIAPRCAGCPGPDGCGGPDADYVTLFGRAELDSEDARPGPRRLPTPAGDPAPPPPRAGRSPATRTRHVVQQVARGQLGGDPLVGLPSAPVPAVATWVLDDRPARSLRQALVRLAGQGSVHVRVEGPGLTTRDDLADLLKEPNRLDCFERIVVHGDPTAIAGLDDRPLRRLRTVSRFEAPLFGPDASAHDAVAGSGSFDATRAALERIAAVTGGRSEAGVACMVGGTNLEGWAAAWPDLPAPSVELAPPDSAAAAPPGAFADALAAARPPCRGGDGTRPPHPGGSYAACRRRGDCEPERCPGWPAGWGDDDGATA